ncbi:MAG TPA: hypothetical protein VHD15_14895 [Hyphomicrobiales bacterium]|nr:hypothetical protein [Hyphomicrobiales bacterium]
MTAAILAALVALLQALARGLGLLAGQQEIAAGKAEQKAIDGDAADALETRFTQAADAYDRLSPADRERLRAERGYYRD